MTNRVEMNDTMLNQVNGGYWYESHKLESSDYNRYGVKTDYSICKPDKFFLPDDVEVGEWAANHHVIDQIGQKAFNALAHQKDVDDALDSYQ